MDQLASRQPSKQSFTLPHRFRTAGSVSDRGREAAWMLLWPIRSMSTRRLTRASAVSVLPV